jgi:hypothetical protein
VVKIRDSLRAEYASRGGLVQGDSAFKVGLTSWVFYVATFALAWVMPLAPSALLVIFLLTTLIFTGYWIAYWSKCSSISSMLAFTPPAMGGAPVSEGAVPICLSCGAAVTPGDGFCRWCGSRMDAAAVGEALSPGDSAAIGGVLAPPDPPVPDALMASDATCPFCGAAYRENARFCSSCGRLAV